MAQKSGASGTGQATKVLDVIVPTDYLSAALDPLKKPATWIAAAPSGKSVVLQMIFTREDEKTVRSLIEGSRQTLVTYTALPNGESFVIYYAISDFAGEDVTIPASQYQEVDFVFQRDDALSAGRPARIIITEPKDGDKCEAREYGGVRRKSARPITSATKNRQTVLHSIFGMTREAEFVAVSAFMKNPTLTVVR